MGLRSGRVRGILSNDVAHSAGPILGTDLRMAEYPPNLAFGDGSAFVQERRDYPDFASRGALLSQVRDGLTKFQGQQALRRMRRSSLPD